MTSLGHLFVLVSDLERSIAFYERLGFSSERMGDYARLHGTGGIFIGMEQQPDVTPGDAIELVIRVDDVDRRYEELQAEGISFDGVPADQDWDAGHVWLHDPDGNRLSLFSSTEDAE